MFENLSLIKDAPEITMIKNFISKGFILNDLNNPKLISNTKLKSMSNSEFVVGSLYEGVNTLFLNFNKKNYFVDLETFNFYRSNEIFIHYDEFENLIIFGKLCISNDENKKTLFIAHQCLLYNNIQLSCNFRERYEKLFHIKYNLNSNFIYVILNLINVNYISQIMTSEIVPAKKIGLIFFNLLTNDNEIIWKRIQDLRIKFIIINFIKIHKY